MSYNDETTAEIYGAFSEPVEGEDCDLTVTLMFTLDGYWKLDGVTLWDDSYTSRPEPTMPEAWQKEIEQIKRSRCKTPEGLLRAIAKTGFESQSLHPDLGLDDETQAAYDSWLDERVSSQ
jgi:hypothetical protein